MPHHYEDTFAVPDGLCLYEQGWLPDEKKALRARIIVVHGYGEHSGRYGHVATFLTQRGYALHTYDQRGHGRSGGRRAFVWRFDHYLDDLDVFLARTRARAPERPLFLFGHSMGGAVCALHGIERRPNVSGLILSSPALKVSDDIAPLLRKMAFLIGWLFPMLPTIRLKYSQPSHDPVVKARFEADPLNYHGRVLARTGAETIRATRRIQERMEALTLPFLVLHGTADDMTDPEASRELYRRARAVDKTLKLYPGFYHETFNEIGGAHVLDDLAGWLDARVEDYGVPAPPSSAKTT